MHVGQVTGLKSSTSGSLAAFERMEQKVVAMEAEADAVGQVCYVTNLVFWCVYLMYTKALILQQMLV